MVGHADGAAVHKVAAERRPHAHLLHLLHRRLHKAVVHLLMHDEALRAGAVLAHALEGAAHGEGQQLVEVRVLAHDERVLPAQLQHHRRQVRRRRLHHLPADGGGADEHHLGHVGGGDERVPGLAVAGDDLHEVGGGARGLQRSGDDAAVQVRGPGGVLGHLDDDGVAGEHVGHQRVEDVVEGVVPGHDAPHHSDRLVLHTGHFVHHHVARLARLGLQVLFSVVQDPLDLLTSNQHLPKSGVHHWLARVTRSHPADELLVVQDVSLEDLEKLSPLLERRFRPDFLSLLCTIHFRAHLVGCHRRHRTKGPHRPGVVARNFTLRRLHARVMDRRVEALAGLQLGDLHLDPWHGFNQKNLPNEQANGS
mmetsp:Transcript_35689/g.77895  ORF Transcript_35689/g.77895 Transcript_35689/m.77895 type:complete len:365 (+) Transcript_35689:842-1936(+)